MDVNQKEYDYDEIIKFTGAGGELDQVLSKLQSRLKKLREKINECEPLFHGKGNTSSIYKCYKELYDKIGTDSASGTMWFNTKNSYDLINLMNTNAVSDKNKDF
ncbi:MAG: hypothetical protein IJS56_04980 [Bacilli bacterium]|nr:hypothetical protein [Bacilli bacterium]